MIEEFDSLIKLSRQSLSIVGLWPNMNESRSYGIISTCLYVTALIFSTYFVLIAQTLKTFHVNGDMDSVIWILCVADVPSTICVIKTLVIRYYSQVVKSVLNKMKDDWKSPRTSKQNLIMHANAKIGKRIATMCIGGGYLSLNMALLLWIIAYLQSPKGECPLWVESYFFFNTSESPVFEMVVFAQGISGFWSIASYCGIDGLYAILVLHLCGQVSILSDRLANFIKIDKRRSIKEKISSIVKRHNEVIRYAKKVEKIFNLIFLDEVATCTVLLCLQSYQLISIVVDKSKEFLLLNLLFITSFLCFILLQLYIYCYVAEQLNIKCFELVNAAYNCEWYHLKASDMRSLIIIMKRAQCPLQLTVGKFCPLSLKLFADIGKTSLGYLSMLLAVKERAH